jgi:hypothetical protein
MTSVIGQAEEVRRILGRSEEELMTDVIEKYLAEADRWIRSKHNQQYFVDKFYAVPVGYAGGIMRTYTLFFNPDANYAIHVYVNGVELISTQYGIVDGILTINASVGLYHRDQIVLTYLPDFYHDYANYVAASKLYATALVDTSNSIAKAAYDEIKRQVTDYQRMANSRPVVCSFIDHSRTNAF